MAFSADIVIQDTSFSADLVIQETKFEADLEIVQGLPGPPGPSAYALAVAGGFVGTEAEWLESLVGPAGPTGPTGATGPQGAIEGGYDWMIWRSTR